MRLTNLFVLAFVTGCMPDVNVVCPEPNVAVTIEAPEQMEEIDTEDTDTDELGDADTDTVPPANPCVYQQMTTNGTLETFSNELTVVLSTSTPSGSAIPGYEQMLRATVAGAHPECPPAILAGLTERFNVTDNAQNGWTNHFEDRGVDVFDLTTDPSTPVMFGHSFDGNTFTSLGTVVIAGGTSHTFSIKGDTVGASSAEDDSARLDLIGLRMVATNGQVVELTQTNNLPLFGGTLVY